MAVLGEVVAGAVGEAAMAQAQVEMAVAIAWAAWAAEAEAEAAWLRLQPSPEGGLQPSLGRTTWRATESSEEAWNDSSQIRKKSQSKKGAHYEAHYESSLAHSKTKADL